MRLSRFAGVLSLLIITGAQAEEAPAAAAACAACHGADGNSAVSMYPKLAGQYPGYLEKQLSNFKSGARSNPIMTGMAATLSPEDIVVLGQYFGSMPAPKPGVAVSNGHGSLGETIYRGGLPAKGVPACAACHGPTGAGIAPYFPRISRQHGEYLQAQLKAFRAGERNNDPAKMMRMVAERLSDQEIAAVADYVQGLK